MATAAKKTELKAKFDAAAAAAMKLKTKPDKATLLKLYSLYKQGSEGDVGGDRPGTLDFVGRAKYDAWAKLEGTTRDEAMQAYIKLVEKLAKG